MDGQLSSCLNLIRDIPFIISIDINIVTEVKGLIYMKQFYKKKHRNFKNVHFSLISGMFHSKKMAYKDSIKIIHETSTYS